MDVNDSILTTGTLLDIDSTALTTGDVLNITANALTSGNILDISSSATAMTGALGLITLSGSNSANTGSLLELANTGTANTNTTFYIKHYATGTNNLAFRVDDVSGDTTPFVIDGTGAVGVGTSTPGTSLDVVGGSIRTDADAYTGDLYVGYDDASATITTYDTNENLTIDPNGTGTVFFHGSTYAIENDGDFIGQRFLDSADNTYYIDPANTTTSISLAGGSQILFGSTGKIATTTNNNLTLDAGSGTVVIGSGTGKLDAGTIDPPYTINGLKFATYQAAMTGIKEETTGTVVAQDYVAGVGYKATLDFSNADPGSDLWLFTKVTDLRRTIDKLVVLLTPAGGGRAWYSVNPNDFTVTIYSSRPATVSYRLTAPRFDWEKWTNTRNDESVPGFIINDASELATESSGDVIGTYDGLTELSLEPVPSSFEYRLVNAAGEVIHDVLALSGGLIANLTAGRIDAGVITSPVAEIDALYTDTISPLATDSSGISVKLGENQTFGIFDNEGNSAAVFDQSGNATFAGSLTADNGQFTNITIQQLSSLREASVAGNLTVGADATVAGKLTADRIATRFGDLDDRIFGIEASVSAIATGESGSATPSSSTTVPELTVTDTLAVYGQTTLGTTSIAGSLFVDAAVQITQSGIDFLGDTFYLLADRLASLDILNGILRIIPPPLADSLGLGTIVARANIEIAGTISPLPGSDLTISLPQLGTPESTESGNLLSGFGKLLVRGIDNNVVAAVDAAGNATFSGELAARKLVIATSQEASGSGQSTNIGSNATVGTGVLPAFDTSIVVPTTSVTGASYIYITPITSTSNNVLYVASKTDGVGFTVRLDTPLPTDVAFNWWVIN